MERLSLTLPPGLSDAQARTLWEMVERSSVEHLELVLPGDTANYGRFLPAEMRPMRLSVVFGTPGPGMACWGPLLQPARDLCVLVQHDPQSAATWWTVACQQLGETLRDHVRCPCTLRLHAPEPHTANDLVRFAVRMAHTLGPEPTRNIQRMELGAQGGNALPVPGDALREQAKWYDGLSAETLSHLQGVCVHVT